MRPVDDSAQWRRVSEALETWFLALDRGEPADLLQICGGDAELTARASALLSSGPGLFVAGSREPSATDPARTIGDFELVKHLGRGGMGSVFLANQKSLSRQVALKLLDNGAMHLPGARLRMRREAELTALLDHPNIVPVYAVGEAGDVPFIAMKYLPGPSLAEVERPLPPEQVARIGSALARALDAAHVHGIVHRDVKPGNVLFDGEVPVFVDFGLARAQSDPTMTQEGKVAGTLRYMAPERLDAKTRVLDPRVDIYGLGATLYELLAARPAFDDDSPTALVRSVLGREPPPLRLRGRYHDLETIVLRAMAKDPARRFASAAAMAEDLDRFLAGQPVVSRRISASARLLRRVQRHPRTAAALAGGLLLALVASGAMLWQQGRAAADRARRLALARTDLDRRHHERAHAALALLAQSWPGDPEVTAWFARARAQRGIDRLFVVVTDRSSNVPPEVLADLLQVAADMPGGPPSAAIELAVVLGTGHCRGRAEARALLASRPPAITERRAARALAAWLDDASLPWNLPPPPADASADEAVVAGLALRLAGAPPDAVLHELSLVGLSARDAPRVLFLEAIARADRGQPVAALQLLRGLADDEAPAPVWRWLGNLYLQLGRLQEAGAALDRAAGDRSPAAQYLRLAQAFLSHQAAGDFAACDALIERARREQPRSVEVERFLAEHDGKVDPAAVPDALARLERLWSAQHDDVIGRDLTLAAMIEVAATASTAAAHRQLLVDWWDRAQALSYRPAVVVANTWLARASCCSEMPGNLLRGLDLFAATCAAVPGQAQPAIAYAEAVALLPPDVDGPVRRTHAIAARSALEAVERSIRSGDLVIAPLERLRRVQYYAWLLAWQTQDEVDMARRLPSVEDIVDDALLLRAREAAAAAAAAQEQFRNR
jgi:predicted Ser/Thr protein kinase/tetratricopeptide (TPR) repeat protein